MSDLISRAELFNRLANVQSLAKAYAVIQDMPAAESTMDQVIEDLAIKYQPERQLKVEIKQNED